MATQIEKETIHFPEEIIEEILCNLPVKSLSRFKCVSKRWRSLISSKQFIKRHLKNLNTNPDIPHHNIILRLSHMFFQQNTLLVYSLRSLLYGGPITPFDNYPRQGIYPGRIWGSCNGLRLTTVNTKHLFLSNQSIKKCKKIQQGESGCHSDRFVYGLGYDESTDDYKVVSINIQSKLKPCRTRIYSSRTGSWKEIEDFDKGFPVDDSGKFVNGRLHWLTEAENGLNHEIVALDLVEEKYEIIARPENFSSSFPYQPILGDLGGYLSLIGHRLMLESTVPMLDTSVWVMMKYGVRESWTKIWTLSDFADPKNHIRGATPLFFNSNGDIAVSFGSSVVVYNGKNKVHESRGAIVNDIIESVVYVESLVSPFADEELGR